jgi:hypothetical protein
MTANTPPSGISALRDSFGTDFVIAEVLIPCAVDAQPVAIAPKQSREDASNICFIISTYYFVPD